MAVNNLRAGRARRQSGSINEQQIRTSDRTVTPMPYSMTVVYNTVH
jgi:hypothetical protein